MARSLLSTIAKAQRDAARAQAARNRARAAAVRQADRAHTTAVRQANQARVAYERAARADEKERARLYSEARAADVAADNSALEDQVRDLESLLTATLAVDDHIDLDSLKQPPQLVAWQHSALEAPEPPPDPAKFAPPPQSGMGKVFGAKKHEAAITAANAAYAEACNQHWHREQRRLADLQQAREAFDAANAAATAAAREQHDAIDAFKAELDAGDPDSIITYFDLVLRSSAYPESFPREFKLAYVPASRQIVVEFQFPPLDVVPAVKTYRYVKTHDTIAETARPVTQVRALYASVLCQITLRTLHEIFEADRGRRGHRRLQRMVDRSTRSTGQSIRPCLITVRTTRDSFDWAGPRQCRSRRLP